MNFPLYQGTLFVRNFTRSICINSHVPVNPPPKITKRFAEEFSIPFTDIINYSFREKRFGDIWEAYNLTPIPKCNPCTVIENLRPIAIISIFSKIQESYALEWMLQDPKDNINRRQFGGIS